MQVISFFKAGDTVLPSIGLPWFVWVAAGTLPIGVTAYALKFYRKQSLYLVVCTSIALLSLVQIMLFLLSFTFCPGLALLVNVVALPFGYSLLNSNLKRRGIERNIDGKVF
jgi:hypothetical protein